MNIKTLAIGAAVIAMAFAGTKYVFAQSTVDTSTATPVEIVIEQAAAEEIALKAVSGTIYKVEAETDDGREIFEVYVISENGQVTEVEIDRQTGEVLATDERRGKGKRKKGKGCEDDSDDA